MTVVFLEDEKSVRIEWDRPTIFCPPLIVPVVYWEQHPFKYPVKYYRTASTYDAQCDAAQKAYTKAFREWESKQPIKPKPSSKPVLGRGRGRPPLEKMGEIKIIDQIINDITKE